MLKVTHVKPHGALHNMAAVNADYALAIGRGIRTVDRDLIYLVPAGSEMEAAPRNSWGCRWPARRSSTACMATTASCSRARWRAR